MIKVGITGQQGFIGSHLYNYLGLDDRFERIPFMRSYFDQDNLLRKFVSSCDVIVHLAAMNRHPDAGFIHDTNVSLVESLIDACKSESCKPHIIFSSSTQEDMDNPYGISKKKGGDLLMAWSDEVDAKVSALVIPNVFGPFGKPFYNSVVATFCHQLCNGEKPNIINDGELSLVYVNELIQDIKEIILKEKIGKINIEVRHKLKVSELSEMLQRFKEQYFDKGVIPSLDTPTELALFNTYRCYIPNDYYPKPYVKHTDDRGSFVEIARTNTKGQFSYSTTKPGITRGNHFHTRKAERFAVISGKASIKLRKVDSEEIEEYIIDGSSPAYVDMPIWTTHNITNIGSEELITLFWINEPYDPDDADTYFVNVENEEV